MANLGFPQGAAAGFSVGAMTDEPLTKKRGERFIELAALAQREAQAALRSRLIHEGYHVRDLVVHSTDDYDFTWDEVLPHEDS